MVHVLGQSTMSRNLCWWPRRTLSRPECGIVGQDDPWNMNPYDRFMFIVPVTRNDFLCADSARASPRSKLALLYLHNELVFVVCD